ncbi:MAG: hypothetical protein ACRYG8_06315, partial [Janthinobacterium lividum]
MIRPQVSWWPGERAGRSVGSRTGGGGAPTEERLRTPSRRAWSITEFRPTPMAAATVSQVAPLRRISSTWR